MDVTVPASSPSDATPDAGPEPELDLTPREREGGARATRRRRNPLVWAALVLVVAAIGVVLVKGLSSAALYYRNADEAIQQKGALGTRRFRVQGTVQAPVTKVGDEVDFAIQFPADQTPSDANTVVVHHVGGDPPELFKAGIPVVLEGHWDKSGAYFTSDNILIKHTAEYKADNPGRVSSNAP